MTGGDIDTGRLSTSIHCSDVCHSGHALLQEFGSYRLMGISAHACCLSLDCIWCFSLQVREDRGYKKPTVLLLPNTACHLTHTQGGDQGVIPASLGAQIYCKYWVVLLRTSYLV